MSSFLKALRSKNLWYNFDTDELITDDELRRRVADGDLVRDDISSIPDIFPVFGDTQRAVEYHHYLISLAIGISRTYKARYVERQDFYTFKSQIRYSSESAKDNRIKVDLADLVETRETLDNHMKFIDRTIGTLDNIIFAIPKRVEIEQISRGK